MVLSLIGPLDNHRVQRVLLVAAFAGTTLKVIPVTIGKENEMESYYRNCHPLGRVPVLRSDEGYLFETNAIIRYIARTERPYGPDGCEKTLSPQMPVPYTLYGRSLQEAAEVDAWLDFVLNELDPHTAALLRAERQVEPAPAAAVAALEDGLRGLEQRLTYLKTLRKTGGALSARGPQTEDADDGLSEEGFYGACATPRASTTLRECSTYNISGHIRARLEPPPTPLGQMNGGGDIQRHSISLQSPRMTQHSPRMTQHSPRMTQHSPRASIKTTGGNAVMTSDILFLVRDALTAADLVVASAVHTALAARRVNAELKQQFPLSVRFSNSVMRLPLATDVRKALGVGLY